jgi:mono/diheme cytochrome c family protein
VSALLGISKSSIITLLGAGLGSLLSACSVNQAGASDADLAEANSRASQGAAVFERSCAGCHGPKGEGLAGAPAVIGINALPRYPRDQTGVQIYQDAAQRQRQNQQRVPGAASRIEFVSAKDLHDYIAVHVPNVRRPDGSTDVNDGEIWALVSFMLIAHGSEVPAGEISPANAADVLIRAQ